MLNDRMDLIALVIGIIFLSETAVGIMGNITLLSYFLVLYYKESTLRARELILTHLIIANSFIILFNGVPHILAVWGWKQLFNDLECNVFLYVHRVGRNVSIGMTCTLSVFQAITINPRNSCLKDLKAKAQKYIGLSISLCWILYMVVNLIFPIYNLNDKLKSKNKTAKRDYGYCSAGGHDGIMASLYAALFAFPEVVFSVLILWSSGSMVVTLYRHKQRVQHIRSTVSSRASPESRATQNILVLVSTFVTFYTFSTILNACAALLNRPSMWLVKINRIVSMCFPSFAPLIFMSHASTLSKLCFVWIRNKKSNLISKKI